jgi:hypothetical protein
MKRVGSAQSCKQGWGWNTAKAELYLPRPVIIILTSNVSRWWKYILYWHIINQEVMPLHKQLPAYPYWKILTVRNNNFFSELRDYTTRSWKTIFHVGPPSCNACGLEGRYKRLGGTRSHHLNPWRWRQPTPWEIHFINSFQLSLIIFVSEFGTQQCEACRVAGRW